jgi:signal transduction histidine kinase
MNALTPLAAPDAAPGQAGRFRRRVFALIFLINLAGGSLIFVYLAVIDVSSMAEMRFVRNWETAIIALVPAVLTLAFCRRYAAEVFEYLTVASRPEIGPLPESDGGGRIMHLRRRALRFPLVCALTSLAAWLSMGAVIALKVWVTGQSFVSNRPLVLPAATAGTEDVLSEQIFRSGSTLLFYWRLAAQSLKGLGLSALIGGMIAAMLFFVIESAWQRELPKFFPAGRITEVKDAWIIPVRYRLIAIFVLVGAAPLILVGILSYQRAATMIYTPPEQVLGNLLLINLFLVVVGVGLALLLAVYVARSVSDPLEGLRAAFDRVAGGDFAAAVPVRANDEIGRVSEGFNQMVASLAEKNASIHELTSGLEEKVRTRTAELSAALAEKERTQAQLIQSEKMASLGILVAGVAHEINNPIGYIYANTDHLGRYLDKIREAFEAHDPSAFAASAATMAKLIASTREGSQRTRDIVSSLRTFSHQDPTLRRPVDLHLAIDHALMLLGHELKQDVTVVRDYAELPFITANPGQLTQVFMNLVINAVQSMRGRPEQKITITTARRGHTVHVTVADTGPGIAPEHLPRLFEPFFTTKDVGEGTGLGLAIAYGIITDHRGQITAHNLPGSGAAFEITLPAEM